MTFPKELRTKILDCIGSNRLENAIDIMLIHTESAKEVVHMQQRLKSLAKLKNNGVKSDPEYAIELNKIVSSMLDFVMDNFNHVQDQTGQQPLQNNNQPTSSFTFNNNIKTIKGNIIQGENKIYRDRRKK